MKAAIITFFCLAFLPINLMADLTGTLPESHTLTITSFNIHYLSLRNPELLNWDARKYGAAEVLKLADADIIALQETETFGGGSYSNYNIQLEYLLQQLDGYKAVAVGDPSIYPSTQPMLIRNARFELLDQGFFFYSETPDRIYSRSWDGRYPAFTSWVRLEDRQSGQIFYLYNLHLDAGSASNRRLSTGLILERIAAREHPEEALIVVGDFNAFSWFPTMRRFKESGLNLAPDAGSTFHLNRGLNLLPAIDHLLFSDQFTHLGTKILRHSFDGVWPSDHYPLAVSLSTH